ncbi:Dam family site-specific DNA-(adenine-N6)-methyltransferase [Oxyplasma meridianum]|uniref:site-specific DNA-methyltransferase (adenine-specific) n=1 Tax=Oxyplasma meridianum TaxID=3073602 RepID=A0AAX4NFQ1_9ARCH
MFIQNTIDNNIDAKPFLKWAGGKSQLLNVLNKEFSTIINKNYVIDSYVEPFIGGGSLFFFLKSKYKINKSYLFDINSDLVLSYNVIKNYPYDLIETLSNIKNDYNKSNNKKDFYYNIREKFNIQGKNFSYDKENSILRTSYLIFLNKTCFNGLFRQNNKGEFNVPYSKYKNPEIFNIDNILKVNKALKDAEIINNDFEKSLDYINKNTIVYFDPPYRPLNKTSNFSSYSKYGFNENDQLRLYDFINKINDKGAYIILSNSDPKNENNNDNFFDELYKNYTIKRVNSRRVINSNGNKRGNIKELIITNF